MSLHQAALAAWIGDTFDRVMRVQDQFHAEMEQSLARTTAKLDAMPLPTTHIPMPVNPVSQSDEE